MDEQQQFIEALDSVRVLLPDTVVATCESLNQHGEWELALGHCLHHVQGIQLPEKAASLLDACRARFQPAKPAQVPNPQFQRTPNGAAERNR
jgi:hypothetical protein